MDKNRLTVSDAVAAIAIVGSMIVLALLAALHALSPEFDSVILGMVVVGALAVALTRIKPVWVIVGAAALGLVIR